MYSESLLKVKSIYTCLLYVNLEIYLGDLKVHVRNTITLSYIFKITRGILTVYLESNV